GDETVDARVRGHAGILPPRAAAAVRARHEGAAAGAFPLPRRVAPRDAIPRDEPRFHFMHRTPMNRSALVAVATTAFLQCTTLPGQEWYREDRSAPPPARRFHGLGFDPERAVTVLFGG